jgi:hypothetical protein
MIRIDGHKRTVSAQPKKASTKFPVWSVVRPPIDFNQIHHLNKVIQTGAHGVDGLSRFPAMTDSELACRIT